MVDALLQLQVIFPHEKFALVSLAGLFFNVLFTDAQ
jgi:hypothetical protein